MVVFPFAFPAGNPLLIAPFGGASIPAVFAPLLAPSTQISAGLPTLPEPADSTEAMEPKEPMEPMDAMDPIDPIVFMAPIGAELGPIGAIGAIGALGGVSMRRRERERKTDW